VGNTMPGWVWKNTKVKLPLRRWTHIGVIYSSRDCKTDLFLDGQHVKSFDGHQGLLNTQDKNHLCFGLNLGEHHFQGMLLDIRIWSRTLTCEEIFSYASSHPKPNDEDLVGWWPLNRGFGISILDRTKNGLHGELTGAVWKLLEKREMVSTLYSDLKSMFNNPIGSDIRICCAKYYEKDYFGDLEENLGGDPTNLHAKGLDLNNNLADKNSNDNVIHAHKIILCQRSIYFRSALFSGMKESKSGVMFIKDIDFAVLCKVIEFVYTDTVDFTAEERSDSDGILELLKASDRFNLPRLKFLCEEHLANFLSSNLVSAKKACSMLTMAHHSNAVILKAKCMEWLLNQFGEVLRSPQYLLLEPELQLEINLEAAKKYFTNPNKPLH